MFLDLPKPKIIKIEPKKIENQNVIYSKKCKLCKKLLPTNDSNNCKYHPGEKIATGNIINLYYKEYRYSCCNSIEVGDFVIFKKALGCKVNTNHTF